MTMTSEICVRRAKLEDRDGVLDVDPLLFGGMDYMPAMYTTLLQNPNFRAYLAHTPDGQIVSFAASIIDPEEEYGCMVSARTRKEYQGQGVNGLITARIKDDLHKEFGRHINQLFVASEKPYLHTQQFWSDPCRQFIQRRVLLVYIVPHAKLAPAGEACIKGQQGAAPLLVETLGLDQTYEVLTDPYTLKHFLRSTHLIAFCNALPMAKAHKPLRLIGSQCNVLASFKKDSARLNGISYSSLIRSSVHVNCNMNLIVYDHVDIVLAHLGEHLLHVAKVVPRGATVAFRITFPTEIDKETVKDVLRPVLGENRVGKVHPMEYSILWNYSQGSKL